jgi:S-DNA-T family DNA segregation ATPase FtsK/SpoIIIE
VAAKAKHKSKKQDSTVFRPRRRSSELPRKRPIAPALKKEEEDSSIWQESTAVVLFAGGVFLSVALYSELAGNASDPNIMGVVGEVVAEALVGLLGWCSFVAAFWAFLLARTVWVHGWPKPGGSILGFIASMVGSVFMVTSCAAMVSVFHGFTGGGTVGAGIAFKLVGYVNEPGALLVSFVVLVLSLGLGTGIATSKVLSFLFGGLKGLKTIFADAGYLFALFAALIASLLRSSGSILLRWARKCSAVSCRALRRVAELPFQSLSKIWRSSDEAVSSANIANQESSEESPFVLGSGNTRKPTAVCGTSSASARASKKLKIRRGREAKPSALDKIRKRRKLRNASGKSLISKQQAQNYIAPSLDLLVSGDAEPSATVKDEDLVENSRRLEQALKDFRIGGQIVEVQPGPIVTLYQFQPAAGVKVQRVISLSDDLALALKVASVRVYAPVPGTGTVGIEVPNAERDLVRLRDVFDSEAFRSAESSLTLALGKDTFGEPYAADLARMPHLLIAGATGTGKSVCINSILMSLLYRHSPQQLQLLLIDPKMLELSVYEGIPHLKAPVVTNAKRARGVLWWAVEEMERRYRLMKDMGVRGLASYNAAIVARLEGRDEYAAAEAAEKANEIAAGSGEGDEAWETAVGQMAPNGEPTQLDLTDRVSHNEVLPWVVIVVDELADLMLTVGREIEELITRLAQKARAAGIHLILATQRPSVNVITGLIKANFPARISFQVASRIDARTVMDTSGAEKLLGRGDMLFLPPGTGRIKRLHSPFVSDKEVRDVADSIRKQGQPQYDPEIEKMVKKIEDSDGVEGGGGAGSDEYDPLYDQAVQMVIEKGQASTSMVQRVFRIGYNRAARILETMEREGVVGPADGAKPRQVMLPNRDIE